VKDDLKDEIRSIVSSQVGKLKKMKSLNIHHARMLAVYATVLNALEGIVIPMEIDKQAKGVPVAELLKFASGADQEKGD
jgi:hypothetical protein